MQLIERLSFELSQDFVERRLVDAEVLPRLYEMPGGIDLGGSEEATTVSAHNHGH